VRIGKYEDETEKKNDESEVQDDVNNKKTVNAIQVVDMRKHPTNNINRELIRKRILTGVIQKKTEPDYESEPELEPKVITKTQSKVGPVIQPQIEPQLEPRPKLDVEIPIKAKKVTGRKIVISKESTIKVPIANVKIGKNKLNSRLPKPTGKLFTRHPLII